MKKKSLIWSFLLCLTLSFVSCISKSDEAPACVNAGAFTASGAPTSFTKKILLTDFTGTWCGNCPIAAKKMYEAINANAKIIGLAIHAESSGSDPMETQETRDINAEYNVVGSMPYVSLDWKFGEWKRAAYMAGDKSALDARLNETANLGLAIESDVNAGTATVKVKVGYKDNPGSVRLYVYILEDGIKADQTNYDAPAGAVPTIVGYEHKWVHKKSLTDRLGDGICEDKIGAGGVYIRDFSAAVSSFNLNDVAKAKVLAFVTDSENRVLNVQEVKLGSTKNFD